MKHSLPKLFLLLVLTLPGATAWADESPHNVVLFVPDGLRATAVTPESAPSLDALRKSGTWFKNSHALFPTFTMPNSSALATGHFLGDTGVYSNTIYTGFPVPSAKDSVTPFLENDSVLTDVDEHYAGNFLNEETLLAAARKAGFLTAAVGKLGPVGIQAATERSGETTIVVDDSTGHPGGVPLTAALIAGLQKAGLAAEAPGRGNNGKAGDGKTPGTTVANIDQQKYFVDVTTKAVLPGFKEAGKPFVLVFWSRDPDGTQHNQGDSLGLLVPGINGPSSKAAIRNADDNLAAILSALKDLGLDKTTDVVIAADHGFSTISKQSRTSPAAELDYADVPAGQLPPGFVAIDLAHALHLPLFDPDAKNSAVDYQSGQHPSRANGLLGQNPATPEVVVAANGGSDLVYLPGPNARKLAPKVVHALMAQDYVSGLFVDDALGKIAGTLPLSMINLKGSALTPVPAIVINFKSRPVGCSNVLLCTVEIADTTLQQGQGMHGSFSRADTHNFMAAIGPDFKSGFADPAPAGNADIGGTIMAILKLETPARGKLSGRVLVEALPGGTVPAFGVHTVRSEPGAGHIYTILRYENVGETKYFAAAGFPGRSVGLGDH